MELDTNPSPINRLNKASYKFIKNKWHKKWKQCYCNCYLLVTGALQSEGTFKIQHNHNIKTKLQDQSRMRLCKHSLHFVHLLHNEPIRSVHPVKIMICSDRTVHNSYMGHAIYGLQWQTGWHNNVHGPVTKWVSIWFKFHLIFLKSKTSVFLLDISSDWS